MKALLKEFSYYFQSICNESFDHIAAIYYLLLEGMTHQRHAMMHHHRRPHSVVDETASGSRTFLGDTRRHFNQTFDGSTCQGAPRAAGPSAGYHHRRQPTQTQGSVSSTCSSFSTGSSVESSCGFVCQHHVAGPGGPMTSLDEGVGLDLSGSVDYEGVGGSGNGNGSGYRGQSCEALSEEDSHLPPVSISPLPTSLLQDLAQITDSPPGSGLGSPYDSFESQVEQDVLTSSLSSCSHAAALAGGSAHHPHHHPQRIQHGKSVNSSTDEGDGAASSGHRPGCFRDGRRASETNLAPAAEEDGMLSGHPGSETTNWTTLKNPLRQIGKTRGVLDVHHQIDEAAYLAQMHSQLSATISDEAAAMERVSLVLFLTFYHSFWLQMDGWID